MDSNTAGFQFDIASMMVVTAATAFYFAMVRWFGFDSMSKWIVLGLWGMFHLLKIAAMLRACLWCWRH